MIPKKIFYCWFGNGSRNSLQNHCIKSWKQCCPDYDIIEINEDNFDVNINTYCSEAYKHGNYSFVSDVARLEALKNFGGFYLDTDILLIKSLDELVKYDGIVCLNGKGFYNNAPLGCSKNIELYHEVFDKLTFGKCGNTLLNEIVHHKYPVLGKSIEIYDNIAFLGNEYFITKGYSATENTIGVHFCFGSWLNKWQGGYNKFDTFKSFEIYQFGFRDVESEHKYYGNNPKIGTLTLKKRVMSNDILFYGNYFYNEKVVRVYNDDFCFERYNADELTVSNLKTMLVEDVWIELQD